jgi:hypothetical protein
MNWFMGLYRPIKFFVVFLALCVMIPAGIAAGKLGHVAFFTIFSWWCVAGPLIFGACVLGLFFFLLSKCDFG